MTTPGVTPAADEAAVEPFTVRFADEQVTDLRERLARTRWTSEPAGAGTEYGIPVAAVRAWADRWRDGFDFAAAAARLNALPQFTTVIDGQRVHFGHVRSPHPDALPLVLVHGWPSSVLEFERVVGPLTDPAAHGAPGAPAFDLVVPSVPGFGFGGPTTETGWDSERVARAVVALVQRLGYPRFGVAGGDVGAGVAREVGGLAPAGLVGVHVLQLFAFPSGDDAEAARITAADWASLQSGTTAAFMEKAGYQTIQQKRPQTLAFGLEDSPAGSLAWHAELWTGFGELAAGLDVDEYLTHMSVYWFTGTAGSAARLYREDYRTGAAYRDVPIAAPVAVAVFPEDFRTIRACAERSANLVRYTEMPAGGHFAYMTHPDLVVQDLREFFGSL